MHRPSRVFPLLVAVALAFLGMEASAQEAGGTPALPETVLRSGDHEALGRSLQRWIEAEIERIDHENNPRPTDPRIRQRLNDQIRRFRTQFWEECERRARQAGTETILKHVADLKAVFAGAFPYKSQYTGTSIVQRPVTFGNETLNAGLWVPRSYNPRRAMGMVISLPPRTPDGRRNLDPRRHLDETWRPHAFLNDVIVVAPAFPDEDLPLDTAVDLSGAADEAIEDERIAWFMLPWRHHLQDYNLDTDRIYLEASRESTVFALRLATYFPDRFAAIVLRDPADLSSVHPESLARIPILLVAGGPSEAHAEAFLRRLEGLGMQNATRIAAQGDFPYSGSNDEIASWLRDKERDLFSPRLVMVPTHRKFLRAYWGLIGASDPVLPGMTAEERPRLEMVADRAQNRINVTARGIDSFTIYLNDLLVDMDKEFTVFINGLPRFTGMRERSGDDLVRWVLLRNDPAWLFVRELRLSVPRGEQAQGEDPAAGTEEK